MLGRHIRYEHAEMPLILWILVYSMANVLVPMHVVLAPGVACSPELAFDAVKRFGQANNVIFKKPVEFWCDIIRPPGPDVPLDEMLPEPPSAPPEPLEPKRDL